MENTIEGLQKSSNKPKRGDFRYWEFDIRESSDETVFVFHDDNIEVSGNIFETSEMTFSQIREAGLDMGISIPTFSEVCDFLEGAEENVMVEIKYLSSEKARSEVLEYLERSSHWKAMATPERFSKSFPSEIRDIWADRFDSSGVELVRVGRHRVNLFNSYKSRLRWFFAQPRWLFGL